MRTEEAPTEALLRRLARGLVASTLFVSALGLLAELAHAEGDRRAWIELFSLSYEGNVPTWYSSLLLASCSLALAHTRLSLLEVEAPGVVSRSFALLAVGFAYMSLDEAVELHEYAGALFHGSGALHFGWVVPALAVVLVVLATLVPLLRALDARTRLAFLAAGAIYVGGAVGCELPLGVVTERWGTESLAYGLVDWVEETMEMIGAGAFLLAILDFATRRATEARA